MNELDFTIEFNSNLNQNAEAPLFTEADDRLRSLAENHDDITGAAINVRAPAKGDSAYLYEVTVVAYSRPEHVAASEKHEDPMIAMKGALSAVERQIRERREKLKKRWEQPGNKPVNQEMIETAAAEAMAESEEETP